QPREKLLVPQPRILRPQDPVVLLRFAVAGQEPQLGGAVVVVQAVRREIDGDPAAVRRQGRLAGPLDLPQVLDGERLFLGGLRSSGREPEQRQPNHQGESSQGYGKHHGTLGRRNNIWSAIDCWRECPPVKPKRLTGPRER